MAQKVTGYANAVGNWSNPWKRIEADQTPAKVRAWLTDKLIARGKLVGLWLPVDASTEGVVACTCVKDTTETGDRRCLTCYGTKFAPGYLKFMHDTNFWCSAEADDFTLTDVEVSTLKKVNVLTLVDGATTGIIETQDKTFANPRLVDWTLRLDAFTRSVDATLTLEWSINAGDDWNAVTLTAPATGAYGHTGTIDAVDIFDPDDVDEVPLTTGDIRFRVTMTRASADDLTPAFEILRMRRTTPENNNRLIVRNRPDYSAGKVLILRTWVQEQDSLEANRGRVTEHQADRAWTAPLDWFNTALTAETSAVRVKDAAGPHPFYEYSSGAQAGTRYAVVSVSYNEQYGIFTHQALNDRRTQDGEHYWLVY